MTPDELEAIEEVRQLDKANALLRTEADHLRTALADIMVVINASTGRATAIEYQVRVIVTRALLGKGAT